MVVIVGAGVLRSRLRARRAHAHAHHQHHHHHHEQDLSWKGLVGMGASAGLIPCPSALVVLLGAIAQHQVGLGLLLITAFSVGLAATLSGLGLAVVYARGLLARIRFGGEFAAVLPSLSAVVIVAAGLVLTVNGIGQVH
jgi:ABC-type nickel/cobalt efflux system permease component RcnA